jgi:regulator of sigma E protease
MFSKAFIILEVLLLFNLLIGVHELGHFLAAKWRGLKIDRFAIWFGKPIWKRKIGGVEYALGWAPFGGYVALPQMATMEAIEGKSESSGQPLPPISPLDKIIVALAGPLFSFLLACTFAVIVWAVGRPVNDPDKTTMIGWVDPTDREGKPGPGWEAGLRPGDTILSIDGHKVNEFASGSEDSINWRIISSEGTNIIVKYLRGGVEGMAYVAPRIPKSKWYERKPLRQLRISPAIEPIVDGVFTNSPAHLAGLQPRDKVVAVDGQKIYSPYAIRDLENSMTNGGIRPVTLTIQRGDQTFDKILTAEKPLKPATAGPSLGIAWYFNTNLVLSHPSPAAQIGDAAGQIYRTLSVLISPKTDVGVQQLGSAVMIVRAYSVLFSAEQGWRQVLWFSVVINVNLALLNMLPFPVLDGGHIALAFIEAIRRRPVSARLLQYIQTGCALVLICFMLFLAFFDTGDWIRSARGEAADSNEPVFAPKK